MGPSLLERASTNLMSQSIHLQAVECGVNAGHQQNVLLCDACTKFQVSDSLKALSAEGVGGAPPGEEYL